VGPSLRREAQSFPTNSGGTRTLAAARKDAAFLFVFLLNSWGFLGERDRSSFRNFFARFAQAINRSRQDKSRPIHQA
jgi:hypothetical protein